MATLISNASGNLTGAATFAAVETGTGALALVRAQSTSLGVSTTSNGGTFTITNGKVIDGVLLWLKLNNATTTGTLTIQLQLSGVSQAAVTVNHADMPVSANGLSSPVFFKFTSTATGDGSANWRISIQNGTGATLLVSLNSATATDFTRALRTTTAGTPTTADDFYVVGELTGAGTSNPLTVTMDQTAATIYGSGVLNTTSAAGGGIHVGKFGTLQFGTTASTNYLLYVNGDLNVWDGGTYNEGTSGTPVPITSTATLKFKQNTLDGDFGLIGNDGGTINAYGVPRTAGKLVVQCKLNADFSSTNLVGSATFLNTITNGSSITVGGPVTTVAGEYGCFGVGSYTDNATSGGHGINSLTITTLTNTTTTVRYWIARGTGTNNRFIRAGVFSATGIAPAQGYYADVDMQAGTIGATGAFGTGSVTSSSIAAQDGGFLVTITGIVSTSSAAHLLGLFAASALGTVSYAGNTTLNFYYEHTEFYQASSIPAQTSLTVDTDTGWLAGDLIALASTTRTIQDCEPAVLNANAGASSLATTLNVLYAHSGTAPTQAEVINLTRNVKICNDSAALMTYCLFSALCTVNMQWTEVFYAGINNVAKTACSFVTAGVGLASLRSATYCSFHDCKILGPVPVAGSGTSSNSVFSNNVMWNLAVGQGPGVQVSAAITLTDWTMDSNTLIRTYSGNGILLSDVGGTFTNNTVVGAASIGIAESEANTLGTRSGNVAHSNGNSGCVWNTAGINGADVITGWRNGSSGVAVSVACPDLTLTLTLFGNVTNNLAISAGSSITLKSPTLNGDSTFPTISGITVTNNGALNLRIENGSLGVASGILTAHTNDINPSGTPNDLRAILLNTTLGSATEIATPQNLAYSGYISSEKQDQTAGNHCYSDDTEVLTLDGWKLFSDVTKADVFATLNPSTEHLEYQPAEAMWAYDYDGKMFNENGKAIDICVTPNHRLWIRRSGNTEFGFVEAQNAPLTGLEYKRNATWDGIEQEWFTLPATTRKHNSLKSGKRECKPQNFEVREYELPALKIPMDLWLKIFGIWIAEGCTTENKRNKNIIITQCNDERCLKYKGWLEDAGFRAGIYSGRNVITNDKRLFDYLRQFGKAHDKFIPAEIKLLSPRQISILLDAMWEGDGCREKYHTVSNRLADDVQELLLKVGKAGTCTIRHGEVGSGLCKGPWAINVIIRSDKNLTPRVGRGEFVRQWLDYKGKVYCVTVPNGLLYVRRNGKACWCGNSTWSRNGKVQTDSVIFHGSGPLSMRMTPNSQLQMLVGTVSGSAIVTVQGWVNGLNWASLYNGQLVLMTAGFGVNTIQTISSFSQAAGTITFVNTASNTVTNAGFQPFLKLESAPKGPGLYMTGFVVPADIGATRSISVWVRKSAVGDGQAYAGAQQQLILRANQALGLNVDTVLATAAAATGTWEQLTGTTPAASGDNGTWEAILNCDGVSGGGWVNHDDWSFT